MLHTEVVSGKTLELLKKLEAENAMTRFNLAGGTSLALYLGHRRSVDLDLFTPKPFDAAELERFLMDKYGFRTGFMERNTLKGSIAFLSTRFPFNSMLGMYERKFPGANVIRPFKAITYFEDIDFDEDIVMLNGKYDWRAIERRLVDMTRNQDKVFDSFPFPLKGKRS